VKGTTTGKEVASGAERGGDRRRPGPPDLSELSAQFPPRRGPRSWPAAEASRGQVLARVLAAPFAFDDAGYQASARLGTSAVLNWLSAQPGRSWQDRWIAGGAETSDDWRSLPVAHSAIADQSADSLAQAGYRCALGVKQLICADVIRPGLDWLLVRSSLTSLADAMARTRDPAGFARLAAICEAAATGRATRNVALARIAMIMAAKGGTVEAITVGDCVEIHQACLEASRRTGRSGAFRSPFFYQLLRGLVRFPETAPSTTRVFGVRGQISVEEMIDRYGIECRPVRDLLVDYLREFLVGSDYATVNRRSGVLGELFWRDLERHNPGIDSLRLAADVASEWKQRVRVKTTRTATPDGEMTENCAPRLNATAHLATVRSFYLDLAQWAAEDPSRWAAWVTVCPIREGELNHKKEAAHRKSRMDQRTRERLPVLPALVSAAQAERQAAAERLAAARATRPGETFTVGGQRLLRPVLAAEGSGRVWGEDPVTGRRRDLEAEERRAFWAWAAVEVLRLTGIRLEELTELSHHSLIHYRVPSTRELVPLLQIVPSKTDTERLLVISPELADVLAIIVTRIRAADGAVPLVAAYDHGERIFNPPMPLLFQWRRGLEDRPLGRYSIRELLDAVLARTGLTDPAGTPLRFTPHDFRRIFVTDAVMHGMPPHIAALVAGHRDINTTLGYKAVYPEEVVNGHRAFLARRRSLRPGEEYRIPTEEEWEEFLGHFERRRVALGDCGRSYSTPCIHEHSCLRCPLLRPSPAQRGRITEIHDNLLARVAEAEREGWAGEVEGLKVSLAGAHHKLAQLDEMDRRTATVHLGIPAFQDIAGRTITTPSKESPS
jgi:integrase